MLKTRILTAIVLLAGFLAALFLLPPAGWLAVVAVVTALAGWEWGGLARLSARGRVVYAVALGLACLGAGLVCGLAGGDPVLRPLLPFYLIAVLFWLLCAPLWLVRHWGLGGAGTVVGVVVLLPTGLALLHLRSVAPWLLLALMSLVWVADIGAYFVGRRWGRHKLAPTISPGKSWEGAGGAAVLVPVYGLALYLGASPHPMPLRMTLLLAVGLLFYTALSIVGDLFESLLKRQAGVKDSSQLLPGHGGILDRIDSLTSTLPLAALLALLYFS